MSVFHDNVTQVNAANLNKLDVGGFVDQSLAGGLKIDISPIKIKFQGVEASYGGDTEKAVVANQTNYCYLNASGTLVINQSGYPTSGLFFKLARVVCDATDVTSITDDRAFEVAGGGSGGTGGGGAPIAHHESHEEGNSDPLEFDALTDGTTYVKFLATERTKLTSIETNAKDDQNASEVVFTATGTVSSTDVQSAIAELDTDLTAHYADEGDQSTLGHAKIVDKALTAPSGARTPDNAGQADYVARGDHTHPAATPGDHAVSHQDGQGDEINVAGLSGELADDQPTKAHATKHHSGGPDQIAFDSLSDGATYKKMLATERTKLAGIETAAKDDQNASEVTFTPYGNIVATNVQSAIQELDDEKSATGHTHTESQITDLAHLTLVAAGTNGDPARTPDNQGDDTTAARSDHTHPASGSVAAHASTHEDTGADEISVAGLSGLLADAQTALAHASTHQDTGADEISVAGLSGLLADPQTPLAHVATHQAAGADELDSANIIYTPYVGHGFPGGTDRVAEALDDLDSRKPDLVASGGNNGTASTASRSDHSHAGIAGGTLMGGAPFSVWHARRRAFMTDMPYSPDGTSPGSTTTIKSPSLDGMTGNNALLGMHVLIVAGTHKGSEMRVTAYDDGTDTITFQPALGTSIDATDDFVLYRDYDEPFYIIPGTGLQVTIDATLNIEMNIGGKYQKIDTDTNLTVVADASNYIVATQGSGDTPTLSVQQDNPYVNTDQLLLGVVVIPLGQSTVNQSDITIYALNRIFVSPWVPVRKKVKVPMAHNLGPSSFALAEVCILFAPELSGVPDLARIMTNNHSGSRKGMQVTNIAENTCDLVAGTSLLMEEYGQVGIAARHREGFARVIMKAGSPYQFYDQGI